MNQLFHWHRNLFDFGGAGVTPVITNILFVKVWGKKTSIHGKILGGGLQPPQPPWFLRLCRSTVHFPQTTGATALHVAAAYGHSEIVKLLLTVGAATDIPNKVSHAAFNPDNDIHSYSMSSLVTCNSQLV